MPRLIDADKLIEICDKGWRLGSAINTKIYHTVDASDIRSQPTVEAIPIEWLKLKIDTVLNIYPNGNDETEVLCKLLYDWEKENERETN